MTFGAMAAWQAWLLAGAAAALAAGLFLMKVRAPRTIVPSMLLWRRVLDESRTLTLWERIRRAVSLAVTVLLAVLLALAIARPSPRTTPGEQDAGRLLIVLDSSLSMEARTRTGETRWQRGVAEARRLIADAPGAAVAVGTTADGLLAGPTADGAVLEGALERAAPAAGDATAWPRLSGDARVHFITDGAAARPLGRDTIVHSVFEPAGNVAITAFGVRVPLHGDHAADAYIEVANYAAATQPVRLTLDRGSVRVFDDTFDVAPSAVLRQVVPIPRGGDPAVRARVEAPDNALHLDDEASVWVERARPLSVVVVSARPEWLQTALGRDPGVRGRFIAPDTYSSDAAAGADVLVFDGWVPAGEPSRPALLFSPPAAPWLPGQPAEGVPPLVEVRPRWETPGDHPVVQGVDPFTLVIDRATPLPGLTPVARSTRGTPLVAVDESAARRLAAIAFGPDDSNLTAAPGFPVLLGNALEWLARPDGGVRKPGLAAFDWTVAQITAPDGSRVPLVESGGRRLATLGTPGLYTLEGGGARSVVAVNAGDPQLSNLLRTTAAASAETVTVPSTLAPRPWWIYCAWAALLLAVLEWWTWQRRITV